MIKANSGISPPACLPTLEPIASLIAEKFAILRELMSQSKRGPELLMEMLPRRKQPKSTPIPPVMSLHTSRTSSISQGWLSAVYGGAVPEVEAAEVLMPEMDAMLTSIVEIGVPEVPRVEMEGANSLRAENGGRDMIV